MCVLKTVVYTPEQPDQPKLLPRLSSYRNDNANCNNGPEQCEESAATYSNACMNAAFDHRISLAIS